MRLGVPIQKPELPAHGGVAVLEASSSNRRPDRAKTGSKGTVRASIGGRCFQNRHSAVGRQLWLLDRYAEAHPEASSDLELVQSLWIQEVPAK